MSRFKRLSEFTTDELILLVLLGGGSFLLASNLSSINVALPHIQREFGAPLTDIKWVAIIGFVASSSLIMLFGRIGDVFGRRRIYRLGMIVYTTGSLLCALSWSLPMLLAFRVVMAVGMAMTIPLAGAILVAAARADHRGQIIGISASFAAAGQLMGPTIGGLIIELVSWRGIFLVNGGIGVVLIFAQVVWLQTRSEDKGQQKLDLPGAGLMFIGLPSLLLALSSGGSNGWGTSSTLFWFCLSAASLIGFAVHESRYPAPLVRLELFRRLPFIVAILGVAVTAFIQNPMTLFVPLYLQTVLDLTAFHVGLLMVSLPLATLVAAPIGGRLADRYSSNLVAAAGLALLFAGTLVFSRLGVSSAPLLVLVPLVLVGIAGGVARTANQLIAYQAVSREEYGSISSLLNATMMLVGTVGTTIAVALSESRAGVDDANSFAQAQGHTFTLLLPVVALGIGVSLLGRLRHEKVSPDLPVVASESSRG